MEKCYQRRTGSFNGKIVILSEGRKPLDCRWVFNIKRNKEGETDRYKTRLVVKGCAQKWGEDYTEAYALISSFVTLRIVLAIINRNVCSPT
jgi:hypothetical protein